MFRRILIANRGEIALRVIRACRSLGVESVAVFSEADQDSPHLEEADKSVCIGPARSDESYLNMIAILQAAQQFDCQAVHPGFGFLAENSLFAERCEQQLLTFIGPRSSAIRLMGDKSTAKETMRRAGLSPIPGSQEILKDVDAAARLADDVGYPVLLKATAGGGGKGMRLCERPEDLKNAFDEASMEAEKAFGNPGLYLEKFIRRGRHIEFQILADVFGNAVHLGERECSVQRNHQKLVEESPSPGISESTRRDVGERVAAAVARVGYRNAGTVEFLMDEDGTLYFMEMNTRLQVEHPVTEMVTGIDIVAEQIRIAANRPLSLKQEEIQITGSAIECRINAEDPDAGFQPTPGVVTRFEPPACSEGDLRLDTHVREGYRIPPFYDSMIGKLIARSDRREKSIDAMLKALEAFKIEGVSTTIEIHKKILDSAQFRSGTYDTELVADLMGDK